MRSTGWRVKRLATTTCLRFTNLTLDIRLGDRAFGSQGLEVYGPKVSSTSFALQDLGVPQLSQVGLACYW